MTADEIEQPVALEMTVSVNGEEWGEGNSSTMYHSFHRVMKLNWVSKKLAN